MKKPTTLTKKAAKMQKCEAAKKNLATTAVRHEFACGVVAEKLFQRFLVFVWRSSIAPTPIHWWPSHN
jgi:hypothetical protein